MADTKAILNRIKSVGDTRKITNAMYLISSTKLRKARKNLEDTRPFFDALRKEISRIVRNIPVSGSKYFVDPGNKKERGKCGILVLTADKGLAGSYNQNVIKKALMLIEDYPDCKLYVSGEYGRHYFSSHNIDFESDFDFPDFEPSLVIARKMAGHIMEQYDAGILSQILIVHTDFKNAMSSEVKITKLLPFEKSYFMDHEPADNDVFQEYEYIPSPESVMEGCIPVYCIGMIYSILVYAFCCEQNDRMMAMDSANQNADELLKELTVRYNRMRQSGITQEITEISASVKASGRK